MSKKSNVHPDHYKTDGRDRPDDAAAARFTRAIPAKADSQQRPDRMGEGRYFERAEPAAAMTAPSKPGRAKKGAAPRAGAAKKAGARKTTKATAARRVGTPRKPVSKTRKTSRTARARPTKKR